MHLILRRTLNKTYTTHFLFSCAYRFCPLFLMLFSRLLVPRIKLNVVCRLKSIERNLVDELNQIKSKDLVKILNEKQAKDFVQLRRSLGGKFQSLQQFQNESKLQIDCKASLWINHFVFL